MMHELAFLVALFFFVEIFSFYVYTNARIFHRLMLYSIAAKKKRQRSWEKKTILHARTSSSTRQSDETKMFENNCRFGKECSKYVLRMHMPVFAKVALSDL